MKSMLELEYQLDQVDYTQKNFVHADLSPDEFAQSMRDHKEGFSDIFLRLMAYGIAKQAGGKDDNGMQLLMALFNKNRTLALKRAMAEQFEDIDGAMAVLDGPKGSTLISQHNDGAGGPQEADRRRQAKDRHLLWRRPHGRHGEASPRRFRAKAREIQWLRAWDMK